jgi:hypothetical protein
LKNWLQLYLQVLSQEFVLACVMCMSGISVKSIVICIHQKLFELVWRFITCLSLKFIIPSKQIEVIQSNATMYFGVKIKHPM